MLKAIFKNSSYLLAAQLIIKVVAFFYTLFLAKSLGVTNFGYYTLALSYFSLLSALADIGLTRYLIVGVAAFKQNYSKILFSALVIRSVVAVGLILIFSLVSLTFDSDSKRSAYDILAAVAILPQVLAMAFDSVFVGLQKLRQSAVGLLVLCLISSIGGVVSLEIGWGVNGVIGSLIVGEIAYLTCLVTLSKIPIDQFLGKIELKVLFEIIKSSFPYGVLAMLGLFYLKIDSVLLAYLKGPYATGIYGAGYKFLEALIFVPSSIISAVFPVMVVALKNDTKLAFKLYKKLLPLFLAVSLIFTVSYLLVLPQLIHFYLPQYLPSIEVIRILALTIPFMFMISLQGVILFSSKRHLAWLTWVSIFNLGLNIVLNLVFIPHYSYIGSAWVTVISDILGFIIFFIYIKYKVFYEI